jgi:hypothetical protein
VKPGGARSKGTSFELTVAKQIAKDLGGFDQQRYLPRAPESGARIQWKGDIVATDKLASIWPFLIECKKQEGWDFEGLMKRDNKSIIKEWYTKACEQAKDSYNKIPLLIFARNYQPWFIAFPTTLFTQRMLSANISYLTFKAVLSDETRQLACIFTYTDFVDLYLRPKFLEPIQRLGIQLGQHKSTGQVGTPGK